MELRFILAIDYDTESLKTGALYAIIDVRANLEEKAIKALECLVPQERNREDRYFCREKCNSSDTDGFEGR